MKAVSLIRHYGLHIAAAAVLASPHQSSSGSGTGPGGGGNIPYWTVCRTAGAAPRLLEDLCSLSMG